MTEPPAPPLLLVEDDPAVQLATAQALRLAGFQVQTCASAEEASALLQPASAGVVVTDVRLPGRDGLALLRELRRGDPELPVVLVTGHGDVPMAVNAMHEGAWDFIEKPFSSEHLIEIVRRADAQRRQVLERRWRTAGPDAAGGAALIGQSAAIQRVRMLARTLGAVGIDVLLQGETGTGKDVVARLLHQSSGARGPFVAINCAALPETVFESEVFGAEPGAYTGASRRRIGKLEHAGDGTVFLDEIESMPLTLQAKLLRVLQERTVERLGSNTPVPLRCRVVAATKVDLGRLAAQGGFRDDLYYRLNVAAIALPPLRERRDDVPLLFSHFAEAAAQRFKRPLPRWTPARMAEWQQRDWPGNVRELRNLADRWVLGLEADWPQPAAPAPATAAAAPQARGLDERLHAFERSLVEQALRDAQGSVARAAEALDLPRKTLHDRLKRLGLESRAFRTGGGGEGTEAP